MQLFFLQTNNSIFRTFDETKVSAWPKLFDDIQIIHEQIGVKRLTVYSMDDSNQSDQLMLNRIQSMLAEVKENDIVYIPTPLVFFSLRFLQMTLDTIHVQCKAKVVFITLDIISFRINEFDSKNNPQTKERFGVNKRAEKRYFNQVDGIITQSPAEAQAIKENFSYEGELIVQGPWGYRSDRIAPLKNKSNTIAFAGNLAKSRYLDKLNQDPTITYNIYGNPHINSALEAEKYDTSWIDDPAPNFNFLGSLDHGLVDQLIEGSFGLVWDSTSYPYITGGRGDYMRVSFSHKFSMYAVAGIPMIVWDKSSMAGIVKDKKIGWTINNLTELTDLIHSISDEEYHETIKNLSVFAELIRDGYFQKKAIMNMVGALTNGEHHEYSDDYHIDLSWDE